MGEAIVVSAIQKSVKDEAKKEQIHKRLRLDWLSKLLWGGTILLAVEHIWHGEIVPWPPFLTAMEDPADTAEMLSEMASVGGTMAIVLTATWGIMLAVAKWREKVYLAEQKLALERK